MSERQLVVVINDAILLFKLIYCIALNQHLWDLRAVKQRVLSA